MKWLEILVITLSASYLKHNYLKHLYISWPSFEWLELDPFDFQPTLFCNLVEIRGDWAADFSKFGKLIRSKWLIALKSLQLTRLGNLAPRSLSFWGAACGFLNIIIIHYALSGEVKCTYPQRTPFKLRIFVFCSFRYTWVSLFTFH